MIFIALKYYISKIMRNHLYIYYVNIIHIYIIYKKVNNIISILPLIFFISLYDIIKKNIFYNIKIYLLMNQRLNEAKHKYLGKKTHK